MVNTRSLDEARRAEQLYAAELRDELETKHRHSFVSIEPESGDYFIGDTLSAAIQAARSAHPNRIAFALRVGHPSAVNLGVLTT
jgi:hypothetical protein